MHFYYPQKYLIFLTSVNSSDVFNRYHAVNRAKVLIIYPITPAGDHVIGSLGHETCFGSHGGKNASETLATINCALLINHFPFRGEHSGCAAF